MRQSQQKSSAFLAGMFKKPLWQTVWTQIRLFLYTGSTLFASILNSSVMLGNYLQQATSADYIFRCIFFLALLRVNYFLVVSLQGSHRNSKTQFHDFSMIFHDQQCNFHDYLMHGFNLRILSGIIISSPCCS